MAGAHPTGLWARTIPLLNLRYREVREWRDIRDASLANREQSNSDHRASAVIDAMLNASFEKGVQDWNDRREALKEVLMRKDLLLVNCGVTPGEPFNRIHAALAGGYAYRVDSLGNVVRDGPDKRSIHSHVGDAIGHGLARLFVPRPQYYPRVDRQKAMKRAMSYTV